MLGSDNSHLADARIAGVGHGRNTPVDTAPGLPYRRPMAPTQGPRTGRTLLVATRLPFNLVARLDALAARLSLPGLTVTRAEATRAAVTAGLDLLEQTAPTRTPEPPAAKPTPKRKEPRRG